MPRLFRNISTMKNNLLYFFLVIIFAVGCKNHYTPKPKGHFRIGFPEKNYVPFAENGFPFRFDKPGYSEIVKTPGRSSGPYDITITIPQYKADIHLTYKEIVKKDAWQTLDTLFNDSRTLVYKHVIKAETIGEEVFINPVSKVYGTIYRIKGNVASPMQFYLTDSIRHFLRGAFYIREVPNSDSLKPIIDFIEPDIIHLIETTTWK
jgi:gliding motility-associated lipoprotein GldD